MRRAVLLFALALVVLLGGVGWISVTALRLERAEAEARRRAALEESVRLSLWRMDSAVLPILAREAEGGPLAERVLLRFRVEPDGSVTSLSESPEAAARVVRLAEVLRAAPLAGALPQAQELQRVVADGAKSPAPGAKLQDAQTYRNTQEWQARTKSALQASSYGKVAGNANDHDAGSAPAGEPLVPVFAGPELILARRSGAAIEGSWLDWPALEAALLAEVKDLLPEARLERAASIDDGERRLAALPVRLVPGEVPLAAGGGAQVGTILGVAWSGVLLAAGAVLALLLGALALSERRAAFVSAVTHELRTPLTTLRAYTEMLADGKIQSEEKRGRYLETLHRESVRLGHLVENVLSWARIEKGRGGERRERVELAALLERARERLETRTSEAGMTLELDAGPEGLACQADPAAVEQILFNLVDNACKYAAGAADRTIRVACAPGVVVRVIDQGPGLPADARARLFQPFSRSAEKAAGSAPGVGLGLALCRRLARGMGGELVLEEGAGTRFALRLRAIS
jgi:signal transduction histidine kinase